MRQPHGGFDNQRPMAVAARALPQDFFSPDQWSALTARSSWRGLWLVAHAWGVIGVCTLIGAIWPLTAPLAIMLIGTRQLGLFILMHDAAHGLLHPNRRINDAVGYWLCSTGLPQYRPYHLQHHRYVQQREDPDLVLSAPFPIRGESLWRKAWRDLSGRTFIKQRFGHLPDKLRLRAQGVPAWRVLWAELWAMRGFFAANALPLALFAAAGYAWVWAVFWLLPRATWFQWVYRIRNIAEHALVAVDEPNPLRQARTTSAGWLERALVAPYFVNYHCEHHLFTQLPCWHLPRAHALLRAQGVTQRMEVQPSYLAMLRLATAFAGQAAVR